MIKWERLQYRSEQTVRSPDDTFDGPRAGVLC